MSDLKVVHNVGYNGRAWAALVAGEVMDPRVGASHVDTHITLCYARGPRAVAAIGEMVRRTQDGAAGGEVGDPPLRRPGRDA